MDWQTLKENIYDLDGGLRDIYIDDTNVDDWRKWTAFVNSHYKISWNIFSQEIKKDKIDFDTVVGYWDGIGEQFSMATVLIGNFTVNAHFFISEQIENDVDPREFNSMEDHNDLLNYLESLSRLLNKRVTLTIENCPEIVLIAVDKDSIMVNTDQNSQNLSNK